MSWLLTEFSKVLLILSVLIGISLGNLYMMWISLEINFLAFIMMLSIFYKYSTSELITYFIVQSFCGAGLILVLMLSCSSVSWFYDVMILLLIVKMGMVPFHMWYMKMIQTLDWGLIWFLSSWQKIIPLYMLTKLSNSLFLLLVSALNSLLPAILMYKQKCLKMIMLFSSLFMLSWVVLSLYINNMVWFWAMIIYSLGLYFLVKHIKVWDSSVISLYYIQNSSSVLMILMLITSLSGVPPFIMFFLKLYIISFMMKVNLLIVWVMLMATVILVYNYLMIFFNLMTMVSSSGVTKLTSVPVSLSVYILVNCLSPLLLLH